MFPNAGSTKPKAQKSADKGKPKQNPTAVNKQLKETAESTAFKAAQKAVHAKRKELKLGKDDKSTDPGLQHLVAVLETAKSAYFQKKTELVESQDL